MFKTIKQNKKLFKFILIIVILLIILYLLYLLYLFFISYNSNNSNKSQFIDASSFPTGTISKASMNKLPSPNEPPATGCSAAPGDITGFCSDYSNCCTSQSGTNSCVCNHPIVQKCKTEYDACMNDSEILNIYSVEQRRAKCNAQVKDCCVPYNEIAIDSTIFKDPIKQDQSQDLICSLSATNNMNITQKCMELCQTHKNCVAFNVIKTNIAATACNLFSSVSEPQLDPLTGKESVNTQNDYYVKK